MKNVLKMLFNDISIEIKIYILSMINDAMMPGYDDDIIILSALH